MNTDYLSDSFDVIVIGGSYAGLSASMQLARARRRVLVIDAGMRRNRFAEASHGFLGHDGRPGGAIVADGRAQLLAYPTVRWLEGTVASASKIGDSFTVSVESGETFTAQRLVLATGVVDELPALEGLNERWGRSVFHCPYCHGYELNEGRVGVLATSPMSVHHSILLTDWGTVTLFTNGEFVPDEVQAADLSARDVAIESEPIVRISETATVELRDGRRFPLDGLFVASRTRVASDVAAQLGCALEEGPLGTVIKTNTTKETTVPGVFACGDAARMGGNVAMAVGDGTIAGGAAHQSLIFRTV